MQNLLFETAPEPGLYVAPAPDLARAPLQALLDRCGQGAWQSELTRHVWQTVFHGETWSAATNKFFVVMVKTALPGTRPITIAEMNKVQGLSMLQIYVGNWISPAQFDETTFAELRVLAGHGQFAKKCADDCPNCDGDGVIYPENRSYYVCGRRIDLNDLAQAIEALEGAVAGDSVVLCWQQGTGLRFEGEGWRAIIAPFVVATFTELAD